MSREQGGLAVVGLAVLVALAGCGQIVGSEPQRAPDATVTPAPVPTTTTQPTATDTADGPSAEYEYWGSITAPENDSVTEPRYLSLRPNCERPPGLVVHIQVAALRNDDPDTHAGINTMWQFSAQSKRAEFDGFEDYAAMVTETYRPLLEAQSVTYGPLTVDHKRGTAWRRVSVRTGDGTTVTYTWLVEKQTRAPYDGCWMTTGVLPK